MGRSWIFLIFIGVGLLSSACATLSPQTAAYLKKPRSIPESIEISKVPFINQSENFCGPATLAMAMNWAGHSVSMSDLAKQTYTPGKQGTLQVDMIGAARRQGLLVVPVKGMDNILEEIAVGHPVIVMQNLGLKWYPVWHYAVAVGYNLKEPSLILHSGPEAFKNVQLGKFERSWDKSNNWAIVVLPPTELSATADELTHASAAAVLENLGKTSEAEIIYLKMLKRWPSSLSALMGLGNTLYTQKRFIAAAEYLDEATEVHPQSAMAWHNLALAQGAAGMRNHAKRSALQALAVAEDSSRERYEKNLQNWLAR